MSTAKSNESPQKDKNNGLSRRDALRVAGLHLVAAAVPPVGVAGVVNNVMNTADEIQKRNTTIKPGKNGPSPEEVKAENIGSVVDCGVKNAVTLGATAVATESFLDLLKKARANKSNEVNKGIV